MKFPLSSREYNDDKFCWVVDAGGTVLAHGDPKLYGPVVTYANWAYKLGKEDGKREAGPAVPAAKEEGAYWKSMAEGWKWEAERAQNNAAARAEEIAILTEKLQKQGYAAFEAHKRYETYDDDWTRVADRAEAAEKKLEKSEELRKSLQAALLEAYKYILGQGLEEDEAEWEAQQFILMIVSGDAEND